MKKLLYICLVLIFDSPQLNAASEAEQTYGPIQKTFSAMHRQNPELLEAQRVAPADDQELSSLISAESPYFLEALNSSIPAESPFREKEISNFTPIHSPYRVHDDTLEELFPEVESSLNKVVFEEVYEPAKVTPIKARNRSADRSAKRTTRRGQQIGSERTHKRPRAHLKKRLFCPYCLNFTTLKEDALANHIIDEHRDITGTGRPQTMRQRYLRAKFIPSVEKRSETRPAAEPEENDSNEPYLDIFALSDQDDNDDHENNDDNAIDILN